MFDRIIRLSVHNSVFVNLTFLLVVAAGIVSAFRLPREEFPEISLDRVLITTTYPGATAEDVEELVTKPIEDSLDDVNNVDKVTSTSQEGVSTVVVTFLEGTDLQDARSEVETAVGAIDDLPEAAELPIVRELVLELPVASVALLGDPGAIQLIDDLADALRRIDGVAAIQLTGAAERKIFVDLEEDQLRALRISSAQVANAIRSAHANVPAGTVELGGEDIFVKTEQRITSATDVARVPLSPGSSLRVGDIASVKMTPDPNDTRVWVDGRPAVKFTVTREETADPLTILDDVRTKVEELQSELPAGLVLTVSDNFTSAIDDRLDVVAINAVGGAVLVIAVLLVLSGFRQSMLAVVGMPISFLTATFLMDQTGLSINVVSTFGLLIAIGIIVDDAIVVIENVQRHLEMGKDRVQATIDGTREVLVPVIVAVLTTCLAFIPLTMVSGTMGRIMKILPLVVIFCLIGSLFEAMFLLPGHLAEFAGDSSMENSRTARLATRMKAVYRPPLRWCVRHPWITALLVTLAAVLTAFEASRMPFQLNAPAKPFSLQVHYEVMPGKDRAFTQLEGRAISEVVAEHMGRSVRSESLRVGSYIDEESGRTLVGANLGKLRWEFDLDDDAIAAYPAMVRALRLALATDPDLSSHTVQEVQAGPPAGAGVTAKLRGRDIHELNRAVVEVKNALAEVEGVSDIRDDYGSGKETFRIEVDQDRASRQGMSELEIANAVRSAIDGLVALEVSIDENPVEIVVRYAGAQQRGRSRLNDLLLLNARGEFVRLDQVASIHRLREAGFVHREDGFRTVQVLGQIDTRVTAPLTASAALDLRWTEDLAAQFPGVALSFGGEAEELVKSLEDLPALFALAILMIFFVLALQFRSYTQPVIILFAVPFGLVGAILGLALLGYDLSIFAMFGMVALAGIVVNDSLVMVDFINVRRRDGLSLHDAVIDGALSRLRPILSTTLTTCLGLLPMALGLGGRDEVLAPMAISISAGLGIATVLVLLAIPALYVLVAQVTERHPRATERVEAPTWVDGDLTEGDKP